MLVVSVSLKFLLIVTIHLVGEEREEKPSTQAHYASTCVLLFYLEMVYADGNPSHKLKLDN